MSLPQNIKEPRTVELLPRFMQRDEANRAFAQAIDELVRDPAADAATLSVWGFVDQLSSEQLDELAWELSVDWWDGSATLEQKRATIKTARQIKNHRGTVYAVKQVVKNAWDAGEVQEWYEYGGEPKHFRVIANTTYPGLEAVNAFRAQIALAKPASAILDTIEFNGLEMDVSSYFDAINTGCTLTITAEAAPPES